jgi:hypothetical protein
MWHGPVTTTLQGMTTTANQNHVSTAAGPTHDHRPVARIRARRALAVLGAAGAALTVWVIAVPLAGADLTVRVSGETQSIELGSVVAGALIAGLVGWALLAVLERVVRRPRQTWTINAGVAFVLSLTGPLGSDADATTTITLIGMHLAVAAVLIPALGRTARC